MLGPAPPPLADEVLSLVAGAVEDPGSLLEQVLGCLSRRLAAHRGLVLVGEAGPDGAFELVASYGVAEADFDGVRPPAFSRTAVHRALRAGPLLVADTASDAGLARQPSVVEGAIRSLMAVPMAAPGETPLGVVYLDRRGAAEVYTADALSELVRSALTVAPLLAAARAAHSRRLEERSRSWTPEAPARLVYASPAMGHALDLARRAAGHDLPVLVTGESGTGKEVLARAVHDLGPRARRPFVPVSCAAVVPELLESELFGHEAGAFTGADVPREGLFVLAAEGTIFLDEVGEMPLDCQARLLRVLDQGAVRPVGANRWVQVRSRVVSATNRDLEAEVEAGRFRRDLFHRLDGLRIHVPPLRERPEDILPLAEAFLEDLGAPVRLGGALREAFLRHPWRGNVRELQNAVRRLAVLAPALEAEAALEGAILGPPIPPGDAAPAPPWLDLPLRDAEETFREAYLRRLLQRAGGRLARAAVLAGLSRAGLWKALRRSRTETPGDGAQGVYSSTQGTGP
ncbi:MAG: sigma-54-dependent Fis family transcriptional regulator [Planctomycetes bacterium]|nr:sigma-54-dependent Fis family transcriptional regulator [Planctomycetota bacterium]